MEGGKRERERERGGGAAKLKEKVYGIAPCSLSALMSP